MQIILAGTDSGEWVVSGQPCPICIDYLELANFIKPATLTGDQFKELSIAVEKANTSLDSIAFQPVFNVMVVRCTPLKEKHIGQHHLYPGKESTLSVPIADWPVWLSQYIEFDWCLGGGDYTGLLVAYDGFVGLCTGMRDGLYIINGNTYADCRPLEIGVIDIFKERAYARRNI